MLTRHVGCNLHLFWCGYWQMGQREKPQYYTSSCFNFSSLLLKWCCCCCKLETELIMNKVNRSQDPILPGITLKWLCSGIEVLSMKGNPTYLLLESGLSVPHYYGKMWLSPLVFYRAGPPIFKREVSRTIKFMSNSKWPLCMCPCLKRSLKGKQHFCQTFPFAFVVQAFCDFCWETFQFQCV